jgi:hypothetical protein
MPYTNERWSSDRDLYEEDLKVTQWHSVYQPQDPNSGRGFAFGLAIRRLCFKKALELTAELVSIWGHTVPQFRLLQSYLGNLKYTQHQLGTSFFIILIHSTPSNICPHLLLHQL